MSHWSPPWGGLGELAVELHLQRRLGDSNVNGDPPRRYYLRKPRDAYQGRKISEVGAFIIEINKETVLLIESGISVC